MQTFYLYWLIWITYKYIGSITEYDITLYSIDTVLHAFYTQCVYGPICKPHRPYLHVFLFVIKVCSKTIVLLNHRFTNIKIVYKPNIKRHAGY